MSATLQTTFPERRNFGRQTAIQRLSEAFRAAYSGRHAAKRLAADADNSPRTAEGWLAARAVPHTAELINLMARNDALAEEIMRLVHEIRELNHCETNTHSASAGGPGGNSRYASAGPAQPTTSVG